MAKQGLLVSAEVKNLPPAKKGKYAGKVRHDALIMRPTEGGVAIDPKGLPEYASRLLTEGKKVVMYKQNKSYQTCLDLFPKGMLNGQPVQKPKASKGKNARKKAAKLDLEIGQDNIEDVMAEAEARNAQMDAIRKSNLPKAVKEALLQKV